jgi:hypothetical protein
MFIRSVGWFFNGLYGVISQKIEPYINIAVRASNPTYSILSKIGSFLFSQWKIKGSPCILIYTVLSSLDLPNDLFLSVFPTNISHLSHAYYTLRLYHPPSFYHPNLWWIVKMTTLLVRHFTPTPFCLLSLGEFDDLCNTVRFGSGGSWNGPDGYGKYKWL